MRLDKWLKVSRLIKRRTVANEACDNERISANGRSHNRGDARRRRNQQPRSKRHLRESNAIGHHILWGARNKEQEEYQKVQFAPRPEEPHGINLFWREEHLHCTPAERTHEQEYHKSPDQRSEHAKARALPNPKGIPGCNLQRLAGNERNDNLQRHHANKGQPSPNSMRIHPITELLRIVDEFKQRPSHQHTGNSKKSSKSNNRRNRALHAPLFLRRTVFEIGLARHLQWSPSVRDAGSILSGSYKSITAQHQ